MDDPHYTNFSKIKTTHSLPLPYKNHTFSDDKVLQSRWMGYLAYDRLGKRIFVTDRGETIIRVFDENGNVPFVNVKHDNGYTQTAIHGYNPDGLLKCPVSICINSYNDILVGDHMRNEILVFNTYLNKCLGTFGRGNTSDECINKPSCMAIDEDNTNVSRLYVTDWWSNNITVWLVTCKKTSEDLNMPKKYDGIFLKKLNIVAPSSIRVTNDRIVAISEASWSWIKDPNVRQIEKVDYGLNCIIVYNKQTYQEINRIQLSNMFNPRGLHIDSENNIYTTAYELDYRPIFSNSDKEFEKEYFSLKSGDERKKFCNKFHEAAYNGRHISKNMFLWITNMNGALLEKVELSFEKIGDFLVLEDMKKIVFISQRDHIGMHLVQFL